MKLQLQSILLPEQNICTVSELYFHNSGEEICFDGYFNQFQIGKWKRYTDITQLALTFQAYGYQSFQIYHNRTCIQTIPLTSTTLQNYEIAFPWDDYSDGVFWFSLIPNNQINTPTCSGFYTGICTNPQHVAFGLDICTFQREAELLRSLQLLHQKIFTNHTLQVSEHIHVYVVDNGNTLHEHPEFQQYLSETHDPVSILKNQNSGGAGGFTRGMLEIMHDKVHKNLTHIVLMDDDALPNPDTFVRMYAFLCARKTEWKDITVGSAILTEDEPYLLYACGESWKKCLPVNPNHYTDLRDFSNTCRDSLLTTSSERQLYSGWWCCCYSLTVVREDNLPIPLFIHHDDIEYGLRNAQYGIVFLNGVSVWHRNFDKFFTPSNLYYDIRNIFIEITQRYNRPKAFYYIWSFYWKRLAIRLVRNKPDAIYWTIRGAADFLKGPEWLWKQDPVKLHQDILQIPTTHAWQQWYESAKICLRLFVSAPRAIHDYRKNLHKYTNADAWQTYLHLEKSSASRDNDIH